MLEDEEDQRGSGVGDLTGDHVELSAEVVDLTRSGAAMTVEQFARLSADELRALAPRWLSQHVVDEDDLRALVRRRVGDALEACSDESIEELLRRYPRAGREFRLYPFSTAARDVGREFLREVPPFTSLFGLEQLEEAMDRGPCLLVANHLSHGDSQFIDFVLAYYGADDLADRLVFAAGPQFYENPYRRMAAMTLNTLPIIESSRRGPRRPTQREAARIVRGSLEQARVLMQSGFALVIYPEGTRSRSGRLGSFQEAAARYARVPGASIVPIAITGTDEAFPIHQHQLRPYAVTITAGEWIPVDTLGPVPALEAAWRALVAMVPEAYQPERGTPALV